MATRTRSTKSNTSTAGAQTVEIKSGPCTSQAYRDRVAAEAEQAFNDSFDRTAAPGWAETFREAMSGGTGASWKRIAVTAVACVLTGWCVGAVASSIISYLTVGALMLTGSLFIASMIYIIGVILTLAASWTLGGLVAKQCLTGGIDTMAIGAYRKVASFFTRKSEGPA